MQTMLRNAALIILLLAIPGSASAIDQSGTEETNCLMTCDANQEHCLASEHLSTRKNYSPAERSSPGKMKSSSGIRSYRKIELSGWENRK